MPVMIALGVAGLAASVGGGVMGAKGQANSAKSQAMQAEINRQWQEFNKELNLEIQRGQMGVNEMDRLYQNKRAIGQSYENQLAQERAAREQFQYATQQFSRNYRQNSEAMSASMASRGTGRGGTADAIKNQQFMNAASDQLRMVGNLENQLDMFENQRNQQMSQLNARSADRPPAYIPSTPIPMPNTGGMIAAAALSSGGAALGGMAGMFAGGGTSSSAYGVGGMGPPAPGR